MERHTGRSLREKRFGVYSILQKYGKPRSDPIWDYFVAFLLFLLLFFDILDGVHHSLI